jgi:hypothetical protein
VVAILRPLLRSLKMDGRVLGAVPFEMTVLVRDMAIDIDMDMDMVIGLDLVRGPMLSMSVDLLCMGERGALPAF